MPDLAGAVVEAEQFGWCQWLDDYLAICSAADGLCKDGFEARILPYVNGCWIVNSFGQVSVGVCIQAVLGEGRGTFAFIFVAIIHWAGPMACTLWLTAISCSAHV